MTTSYNFPLLLLWLWCNIQSKQCNWQLKLANTMYKTYWSKVLYIISRHYKYLKIVSTLLDVYIPSLGNRECYCATVIRQLLKWLTWSKWLAIFFPVIECVQLLHTCPRPHTNVTPKTEMLLFVTLHWDLKAMFVCVNLLSKKRESESAASTCSLILVKKSIETLLNTEKCSVYLKINI